MPINVGSGTSVLGQQAFFIPSLGYPSAVSIFIPGYSSLVLPRWGWARMYLASGLSSRFFIASQAPIVGAGISLPVSNPNGVYSGFGTLVFDWKEAGVFWAVEYFSP